MTGPVVPQGGMGLNVHTSPGRLINETEGGFKFFDELARREVWLPKSQVTWDRATKTMSMPFWLAAEKELL